MKSDLASGRIPGMTFELYLVRETEWNKFCKVRERDETESYFLVFWNDAATPAVIEYPTRARSPFPRDSGGGRNVRRTLDLIPSPTTSKMSESRAVFDVNFQERRCRWPGKKKNWAESNEILPSSSILYLNLLFSLDKHKRQVSFNFCIILVWLLMSIPRPCQKRASHPLAIQNSWKTEWTTINVITQEKVAIN